MYSKYICNEKFQVSAIKLISATLFFIYFFKMIKLLKWVTFSHINSCNKDIPYLGLNAPINVFFPCFLEWQDSHGKLDSFEALGVQNPLGGQFIKFVV